MRDSGAPTKKYQVTSTSQKGSLTLEPKLTTQTPPIDSKTTTKEGEQKKVLHPHLCQCIECKIKRGETTLLDAETCGAPFEIIIDIWHARNPDVKPLSEHEVQRIGKAFQPMFQRYLGIDLLLWLTPIIVGGQILVPRFTSSVKSKKKKEKNRDYRDEPSEESDTARIEGESEEPPRRKYFSSKKIDDIKKEGERDD